MNLKSFKFKLIKYSSQSFLLRALFYALLGFLFLRLFSSLVLLIGIIQPNPVAPYSEISKEILLNLESKNFFTRYFLAPWYRWDTTHYLEISDYGYGFDLINTVWPPLYPFLIKIFRPVCNSSLISSIFVSNGFFVLSLFLLYKYVNDLLDEETAKNTLLFIISFPSAFFFIAGYSESLFLSITIGFFILLKKQKWLMAGLLASLAALTRVQGVLFIIPLFVELIRIYGKGKNFWNLIKHSLACLYAPLAYGLFSVYVFWGLHANWPWETLSSYWDQRFGWPWEGFYFTFLSLIGKNIYVDYTPQIVKISNILFPLISIYVLIKIRKKLPLSLNIFSWIMLYMVIGKIDYNNTFVSVIRYLITIFPIFISLSITINKRISKLAWIIINVTLQVIFLIYFYWWVWVA